MRITNESGRRVTRMVRHQGEDRITVNTSSRLFAVVQVPSHQGLRQPEQAEKACCHEDERHGLSSNPVQSDRASFQDCPWPLVGDPRDCDRSVVGSVVRQAKGHQKAP